MKDLSASIAKLMGISGKVRRMDSMMIESNIRKLSRMELTYTCIAKLAMYVIQERLWRSCRGVVECEAFFH